MSYVLFSHPEFNTPVLKNLNLNTTLVFQWQLPLLQPVFSSMVRGRCCINPHAPPPPPRPLLVGKITLWSMQNQSATAVKGQYVTNKRTEAEWMLSWWSDKRSQSSGALHLHYTLCQGFTMWRECRAERWITGNKRPQLSHYHHLLFTGPSIYWATRPSCSAAGSLNVPGYVLKGKIAP